MGNICNLGAQAEWSVETELIIKIYTQEGEYVQRVIKGNSVSALRQLNAPKINTVGLRQHNYV